MEELQNPATAPVPAPAIKVTPQGKEYLNSTYKWGRFVYIMSLIGLVIMVLCAIVFFVLGNEDVDGVPAFELGIIILVVLALYIAPVIFLCRSLKALKAALQTDDDAQYEVSLKNFKSLLKYYGILLIICLAIYAIAIVVGVVIGLSAL